METVNIRQSYPLLSVMDGAILSKRGDITFGWEMSLPAAFRCDEEAYDSMVATLASAIALLDDYTVVHKQDIFMYRNYARDHSDDFLQDAYERHFEGRRYLDHICRIFLTFSTSDNVRKSSSGLLGILTANVPKTEEIARAKSMSDQFETMLKSNSLWSLTPLSDEHLIGGDMKCGIIQDYLNFTSEGPDILSDIRVCNDRIRTGDKVIVCHTLSDLDQMPGEISPYARVAGLSTEHSLVNLSFLNDISSDLDCEHIVNQFILKLPQKEKLDELDIRRKRMTSMSLRSSENRVYAEELNDFLEKMARERRTVVGCHLNVLSAGAPEQIDAIKGKVTAAISKCGIAPVYNIYDTPNQYWASIPGNAAGLNIREYMTMELEAALCTWLYDGREDGIPDGSMKLCDRQRMIPVRFDIQERIYKRYIENFNVFVLGPSGSGKSFFMNKYLKSCYDCGQHVFMIDIGESYRNLCGIVRESSGGKDGAYYTYETGAPMSFNPFRNIERFKSQDNEAMNFLYTLMCSLWKKDSENIASSSLRFVKDSVMRFVTAWAGTGDPVFDDYYAYVSGEYRNVLAANEIEVRKEYFDLDSYLLALMQYRSGETYGYLLNSRESADILENRFVVFEIDRIKDDDTNYPVAVLVIMDAFMEKMRKCKDFKVLVIEEAWKALMGTQMSAYVMEMWKVARKHRTSAIVVSQELKDITSSTVVKDTIIENSAVKILLDQSKYLNRFDVLADALSLNRDDKAMVLSLNRVNNDMKHGREVFFSLGNRRSFILRVEVSPEERIAFSSDSLDRARLADEVERIGSYREAIMELIKRQ